MNDQLSDFIHFMTVERGLSENTIVSYKRDLQNYLSFLMTHEQLADIKDVTRLHIIHYLKQLKEEGKSSKTSVRHLSSIRSFHQFLLREKVTTDDPSWNIETQKQSGNYRKFYHSVRSKSCSIHQSSTHHLTTGTKLCWSFYMQQAFA